MASRGVTYCFEQISRPCNSTEEVKLITDIVPSLISPRKYDLTCRKSSSVRNFPISTSLRKFATVSQSVISEMNRSLSPLKIFSTADVPCSDTYLLNSALVSRKYLLLDILILFSEFADTVGKRIRNFSQDFSDCLKVCPVLTVFFAVRLDYFLAVLPGYRF